MRVNWHPSIAAALALFLGGCLETQEPTRPVADPPVSGGGSANSVVVIKYSESCDFAGRIGLRLHDKAAGTSWPSGSGTFNVTEQSATATLRCSPGNRVCWGAEALGTDTYWGAGLDGDLPCRDCCFHCDDVVEELDLVCEGGIKPPVDTVIPPKGPVTPVTPVPTGHSTMTFNHIRSCAFQGDIGLKIRDMDTYAAWPEAGRHYIVSATESTTRISCRTGSRVCWGAGAIGTTTTWGIGLEGDQGCQDCCRTCGETTVELNLTCPGGVDPAVDRNSLVFDFMDKCNDGLDIGFRLFAPDRNLVWPAGGQVFLSNGLGQQSRATIQCTAGDRICYGAAPQSAGSTTYWGVGLEGKQGCTGCCYACDGSTIPMGLTCL